MRGKMSGVNKRTALLLVVVAAVAGLAAGGVIGFIWHAPGRPTTWTDARGWATFLVVVLGFSVAAYELNLQRRQFAEESRRNIERDDLLDKQRVELQHNEESRQRAQADEVNFDFWLARAVVVYGGVPEMQVPAVILSVENKSKRPIREVVCRLRHQNGTALAADRVGSLLPPAADRPAHQRLMNPSLQPSEPLIRARERYGFTFPNAIPDAPMVTYVARFTDDAEVRWELDRDMRLTRPDDPDAW